MDIALKAKYSTRELKQDIVDAGDVIIDNSKRIKKIEDTIGDFTDHTTRHREVIDPKLDRLDKIMFGELGDNGIAVRIKDIDNTLTNKFIGIDNRMEKIESGINKVLWVVILAVLGAVLKLVIFS